MFLLIILSIFSIKSIIAYLEKNEGKRFKLTELMEKFKLNPNTVMEIIGKIEREYGLKISFC